MLASRVAVIATLNPTNDSHGMDMNSLRPND